jgi:hypothetical protein
MGTTMHAWKLVAWACRVGGDRARSVVAEALVMRRFDAVAMHGNDAAEWRRCGRITHDDMTVVLQEATVVVGAARLALFA